jgi:hypothetical protein
VRHIHGSDSPLFQPKLPLSTTFPHVTMELLELAHGDHEQRSTEDNDIFNSNTKDLVAKKLSSMARRSRSVSDSFEFFTTTNSEKK